MKERLKSALAVMYLRLFARLPLSLLRIIARISGWLMWQTNGVSRRVTEINLKLCFPTMPEAEREALAKASLLETARAAAEIPHSMLRPGAESFNRISKVTNKALVDEAMAAGKGVIVIAPHLGNWEYLGRYLEHYYPITNLYKPAKYPALDEIIKQGRCNNGAKLMPTNKKGVLGLLKCLKNGEMTGILPDQIPDSDNGTIYAPFFGEPAATMSLLSNFIQRTGAKAVGALAKRLADGSFEVIFIEADNALYAEDVAISVAGLNKTIEQLVLSAPAQYQWEYKRFRKGPEGKRKLYKQA